MFLLWHVFNLSQCAGGKKIKGHVISTFWSNQVCTEAIQITALGLLLLRHTSVEQSPIHYDLTPLSWRYSVIQ